MHYTEFKGKKTKQILGLERELCNIRLKELSSDYQRERGEVS